jgi:hypothetical protein
MTGKKLQNMLLTSFFPPALSQGALETIFVCEAELQGAGKRYVWFDITVSLAEFCQFGNSTRTKPYIF